MQHTRERGSTTVACIRVQLGLVCFRADLNLLELSRTSFGHLVHPRAALYSLEKSCSCQWDLGRFYSLARSCSTSLNSVSTRPICSVLAPAFSLRSRLCFLAQFMTLLLAPLPTPATSPSSTPLPSPFSTGVPGLPLIPVSS